MCMFITLLNSICIPILQEVGYTHKYEVVGVLSVEHLGRPPNTCDGILLTVLLKLEVQTLASDSLCQWMVLGDEDLSSINKAMTVPYGCAKLLEH